MRLIKPIHWAYLDLKSNIAKSFKNSPVSISHHISSHTIISDYTPPQVHIPPLLAAKKAPQLAQIQPTDPGVRVGEWGFSLDNHFWLFLNCFVFFPMVIMMMVAMMVMTMMTMMMMITIAQWLPLWSLTGSITTTSPSNHAAIIYKYFQIWF